MIKLNPYSKKSDFLVKQDLPTEKMGGWLDFHGRMMTMMVMTMTMFLIQNLNENQDLEVPKILKISTDFFVSGKRW